MNLNSLMHHRNIYKDNTPDFKDLAAKYPYFKLHARENHSGNVTIDFKHPEALRALLYALLENDFDMTIEIPLDRLIPTLPLRLNYIHWIEDLVHSLHGEEINVTGVDVGTGASCIYPLLGAKLNGWRFLATEVDEASVRYAKGNVQRNGFSDNIKVQLVRTGNYLAKPLQESNIKKATFCMCNPPFFCSEDEAVLGPSRTDKRPIPISVNTGSTNETVTTGGEVEFVKGIIMDSLELQEDISWYTSMLGKKTSLKDVVAYLKENNVPTVTTTQFCQGKTMRWGVAWTFTPTICTDNVKSPPFKRRKKESKPLVFTIPKESPVLPSNKDCCRFEQAAQLMDDLLTNLKITVDERLSQTSKVCQWQCSTSEITWTNQRKKRRQQNKIKDETSCSLEKNISKNKETTKENNDSSDFIDHITQQPSTNIDSNDQHSTVLDDDIKQQLPTDLIDPSVLSTPLCIFQVRLLEDCKDELQVQVQCISAEDKNHVYQLYQFLHNKIAKGL